MRYGRLLISGSLALIVSLDIDILAVTQNPLYPTSRRHIPVNIKITGIRAPKLISIGKCYDPVRLVKEDHFNKLSASTVWFLRMISKASIYLQQNVELFHLILNLYN